jgi:dihydroneopterin triphosphate diphosphatase
MTGDLQSHTRIGVATFLLRRHGATVEVLLLRRATRRFFGHWFPIEGRTDMGETPEQAALREVREETRIDPSAFFWGQREPVLLEAFGLAMYVFVGFTDPSAQVVLNEEHSAYAWLLPREAAIRLPFPSQRAALRKIYEHFIVQPPEETLRVF